MCFNIILGVMLPWQPMIWKVLMPVLNFSYFNNLWRFITIFRNFYKLKIVRMMKFMVKSVKIMYYAESGAMWVIYISLIDWL